MIEITFRQYPPGNSVFAPGAFDDQVGEEIPFRMEDATVQAVVTAVMISTSGRWAMITVQLPVSFPSLLEGISISSEDNES